MSNLFGRAIVVAGHTGDEPTARSGLAAPNPSDRVLALGALERLGALSDADLSDALRDPAAAVRRRAAEIAATHPDVDLVDVLADPDPGVAETAAWACGEHESDRDEIVFALIDLATGADDALVREAAVAALGAIGDPRGLPAILAGCRDKPTVRRRAVLALAPFDGPEVDAALAAAHEDHDWQVRQSAEDLRRALED